MKKKYKKGLWHILALFSYKDDEVSCSFPIRIRKFRYKGWLCERHGNLSRYLKAFPNADGSMICPACKADLKERDFFMYCLYADSKEFINVINLLSRYTILSWRKLNYRQKATVVAYASDLDSAIRGVTWCEKKHNPEVDFVLYPITQEEMDKLFEKSENNRLLRVI